MPDANVLFQNLFPGVGYPGFTTEWPNFTWPSGNPTWSKPVVDGHDHGMGSRTLRSSGTNPWRGRSTFYPGRVNYKVDIDVRWRDPGNQEDEVGVIVRFKDYNNLIVARLKCGSTPELKVYRILGGTATQLGSTYTGFSTVDLFRGLRFRVRVEDLADLSGTRVTVYRDPTISDNGTSVVDATDAGADVLAGALYTCGIELRNVYNDRVAISSLTCYDFADEWAPGGSPANYGLGWQVEFGDTLYTLGELEAMEPKITLIDVKQAYGQNGMEARFGVHGTYKPVGGADAILHPGQSCRVLFNGEVRFTGTIAEGDISASSKSETQTYRARGPLWASRLVILEADDKTGAHHFNVYAPNAGGDGACSDQAGDDVPDEYDPELQDMTIGDIILWLFARYSDGDENLRFHGAIPASGNAYVTAELNELDAIIPDLTLHGNFYGAIMSLLKYMPKFQLYVDPATKIWHFVDVLDTDAETIALPNDVVPSIKISPDPDKSYTAVVWRGGKPQNKDPVTLSLSDGSITPAWTPEQEENHDDGKQHKRFITIKIAAAGALTNFTYKGKLYLTLQFLDISLADAELLDVDPDDWRGSLVTVQGFPRFIIGNTSTRFYLSAPNWSSPPSAGETFLISYEDPCAQEALSAAGVGQGYYLHRPGTICGVGDTTGTRAMLWGAKNKGFCGQAKVTATGYGPGTSGYVQQYEYRMKFPSVQAQQAFGICDPTLFLSKPITRPVSLINYFKDVFPEKSSAPKTACQGMSPIPPQVNVTVELSEHDPEAAYQRYPAGEGTYHGPAYSENAAKWDGGGSPEPGDWRCRNVLVVDDPEFRDEALQGPGILLAMQAIIALFGQKAYTMSVQIATPWLQMGRSQIILAQDPTSRFADLSKCLRLASTKRVTGMETADLPIYSVTWEVQEQRTTIMAGTPISWAQIDPKNIASTFVDKNLLKKVYNKMKELEEFRNALIAHSPSRVGGPTSAYDGCNVSYSEPVKRTFSDMNTAVGQKDRKIGSLAMGAELDRMLTFAKHSDNPGSKIALPGLSGAAAQQPVRSAAVLESVANPQKLAEEGPSIRTDINANRGRYGGLTGIDDRAAGAGEPPAELARLAGGYAFRVAPDGAGNVHGGGSLQYAALDAQGAPGSWVDLVGPTSFPNAHVPLKLIADGTLMHTLLSRIQQTERLAGASVSSTTEKQVYPGDVTAQYPDGAPADLITTAIAMAAFQNSQLVNSSLYDPGGPVFTGSKTADGVDSQTFWRVQMPERVVAQVEAVSAGTGQNGGNWGLKSVGNANVYADGMALHHKQQDGALLAADQSSEVDVCSKSPAPDDSDFGFSDGRGRVLDPDDSSGAGTIFPMPKGAHGVPMVEAVLTELLADAPSAGLVHEVRIRYQYKASAWTSLASVSGKGNLTSDGSGTGVGNYKGPAGAIPAGLRVPSNAPSAMGVSVQRFPGTGGDNANGNSTVVIGIGVTLAVVDGGIWIRIKGTGSGCAAHDETIHNHPQQIESVDSEESFALDFTKVLAEAAEAQDSVALELNPPVSLDESPAADDETVLDFTKALAEAGRAADSTLLELNP